MAGSRLVICISPDARNYEVKVETRLSRDRNSCSFCPLFSAPNLPIHSELNLSRSSAAWDMGLNCPQTGIMQTWVRIPAPTLTSSVAPTPLSLSFCRMSDGAPSSCEEASWMLSRAALEI